MLPNSVGNAKIKATSRIIPQGKDDWQSMHSSREVSAFSLGPSPPMLQCGKKGHTQCWECNNAMHHKCMRCSFLTMCNSNTERVKERKETVKKKCTILPFDKRTKSIDPRTLSPEDLTQFELNAALNQFKINFENPKKTKKRRCRFNRSVCRIIELLNPNLLILYKKCGRLKRQQIEEHLFRTSEKSQQTFIWHKAALEFIMERLNIDPYSIITRRNHEVSMLQHNYERNERIDVSESSSLDYSESNEISRKSRKKTRWQNKKTFAPDSSRETFLVFVKPTDWLTEITCTHCTLNLRLSEFSKHYATYHCLPIECMDINETRRISLDPNRLLSRRICPHTLFLVRNVVRNLGGSDFRNFYPLVLTTAVQQSFEEDDRKRLILWLSGIALGEQIEVCMKVTNVAMSSESLHECPMLRKIYSITNSQNIKDINESDAIITLAPDSFIGTTRHGNKNIILEVSVKIANTSGT